MEMPVGWARLINEQDAENHALACQFLKEMAEALAKYESYKNRCLHGTAFNNKCYRCDEIAAINNGKDLGSMAREVLKKFKEWK
jgi:hypothetical protein